MHTTDLLSRNLRTLGRSGSQAAGFSLQPDPAARHGSVLSFAGEHLTRRRQNPPRHGMGKSAVRSRIRELIDSEAADDIMSDDKLVSILQAQGVDIARRTVAKYRESLRIPSSVQRRREKALRSA